MGEHYQHLNPDIEVDYKQDKRVITDHSQLYKMNVSDMNFTGTLLDYKTESYKTDHLISAPWVIPLVLLILSSITGNLVVMIAWVRHPQLHTAPNLHIVSLAAADCLVAAVSMPITVIRMTGNQK